MLCPPQKPEPTANTSRIGLATGSICTEAVPRLEVKSADAGTNTADTVLTPIGNADVVSVAMPLTMGAVPSIVAPLKKFTVPFKIAGLMPAVCGDVPGANATLAVSVTASPKVATGGEITSCVRVGTELTPRVTLYDAEPEN